MKKRFILPFVFTTCNILAQGLPGEYTNSAKKADSLFKAGNYKEAALNYSAAFKSYGWKGTIADRLGAARSWAKAGIPDSAFGQLFRLADKTFLKDAERLQTDDDLRSLRNDKRWEKLLAQVKLNGSFNFGMERAKDANGLPDGWFQWGTKDYVMRVDSTVKHGGKFSIVVEPLEGTEKRSFGCPAYQVVNKVNGVEKYAGTEIEVRAFIKMDNNDAPLGLLLRLDGDDPHKSLGFDNMTTKGIKGTKDWQQYSVKLPFPKGVSSIFIGVINGGTGKVWCDDFELLIDGKPLSQ